MFHINKKNIIILCFIVIAKLGLSQSTTVTIYPTEDANLRQCDSHYNSTIKAFSSNNYSTTNYFSTFEWTYSGYRYQMKSLMKWDMSSIPADATITSARLYLYGYDPTGSGSAYKHANSVTMNNSGYKSNASYLKRITSVWSESNVTWNTCPNTTETNKVSLASSSTINQDYLSINITNLVRDMQTYGNHGLYFSLKNETSTARYSSMAFCSSDHSNSSHRPRIRITYSLPTKVIGGGNTCPGQNGGYVGLTNSINRATYRIYRNGVFYKTMTGTGNAIGGPVNNPGTYTITRLIGILPNPDDPLPRETKSIEIDPKPIKKEILIRGSAEVLSTVTPLPVDNPISQSFCSGESVNLKSTALSWKDPNIWKFYGNVSWDEEMQAWKCVGYCQMYLKYNVSVPINTSKSYKIEVEVYRANDETKRFYWGGKRLASNRSTVLRGFGGSYDYSATRGGVYPNVGQWVKYSRIKSGTTSGYSGWGTDGCKYYAVGGLINYSGSNNQVTYVKNIKIQENNIDYIGNTDYNYRWYRNGSYTGVTSSSYNATTSGDYYCKILSGCGTRNSKIGNLTYKAATIIKSHPTNKAVCPGNSATFRVKASGSNLSYQWQYSSDGTKYFNISGATGTSYTNSNPTTSHNGRKYRCIVTGTCGTKYSNAATLTIYSPVRITKHPANKSVCSGNSATFSVAATGSRISYQWQYSTNGGTTYSDISGANRTSYTNSNPTTSHSGRKYRCKITNTCGTKYSNAATLTIYSPVSITGHPSNKTVCPGNSATFSVAATGSRISYQWQYSTNGGSSYSNISGATSKSYTNSNPTINHTGRKYRCKITNTCGMKYSNSATLIVSTPITITSNPANESVCPGTPATFNVSASGSGNSYQWQYSNNGSTSYSNISGATGTSYTNSNPTTSHNGRKYRCKVTGTCGTKYSNAATLTVSTPITITSNPANKSVCPGTPATFNVSASGSGNSYQWQYSNNGSTSYSNISGATGTSYTNSNPTTSHNGRKYRCKVTGTCGTENSNAAALTVQTPVNITSQPDSTSVCEGSTATFSISASGSGITYQWRFNGTNIPGATNASYSKPGITTADEGNYSCVVTGTCGSLTSNNAILNVNKQPIVNTQPTDKTECEGSTVTFNITASGTGLNYQWRFNNTDIPGATSSSYTITNVTTNESGNYICVITGTCGSITSNNAMLNVNSNPVISTQPVNQIKCEGSTATFRVAASGSELTYQWQYNGVDISGATNLSYSKTGITAADAGNYRCLITGTCGTVTSNTATLTVNQSPLLNSQPSNKNVCEGETVDFNLSASGIGITYQWRLNGTNIPGATSPNYSIANISTANAGNYDCIVTGTCGSIISNVAVLTVNANPAVTISGNDSICKGSSTQLTASGGISYNWSPSAGLNDITVPNPIANPTVTTTYSVIVTNENGCSSAKSISIIVNELPKPTITGETDVCEGSSNTSYETETDMNDYIWTVSNNGDIVSADSTSDFSVNINWLNAGEGVISVNYMDENGCEATNSTELNINVQALPTIYNVIGGGFFCVGDPGVSVGLNNSEADVNYILYRDGEDISISSQGNGNQFDFGIFNQSGEYTVEGTKDGCVSTMNGKAIVTSSDCDYSIILSKNSKGSVYKTKNNKLKFVYKVKYNETGNLNYIILNSLNQEVSGGHYLINPELNFGYNNFELNIEGLAPGIYILEIRNAKKEKWHIKFEHDI